MPQFTYQGQSLDIEHMLRTAKTLASADIPLWRKAQTIRRLKQDANGAPCYQFIKDCVFMYAKARLTPAQIMASSESLWEIGSTSTTLMPPEGIIASLQQSLNRI